MKRLIAMAALALALLPAPPAAATEPRFDPSFGARGTVTLPFQGPRWKVGAYDIAADARGGLIAAGTASPPDDERLLEPSVTLAKLLPNGKLDRSFGSAGILAAALEMQGANGVAVQPDRKIVVVGFSNWGHSADINSKYAAIVVRLNPDGSRDRSFNGGRFESTFVSVARDVALQASGRIVVAGIEVPGFQSKGVVLGFKPNGKIDRTFGKRGRVAIFAPRLQYPSTDLTDVFVQPGGKLLLAGELEGRVLLARLLPNDTPDPAFGGGDGRTAVKFNPDPCRFCSAAAHAVRVQSDGRIVVLAHEDRRRRAIVVARFLPDGRLDRSFGSTGPGFARRPNGYGLGLAIQRDDKIVVAGRSGKPKDARYIVLRYLPGGTPDPSFGANGALIRRFGLHSEASSALVQPDGRIVVAGHGARTSDKGRVKSFLLQRFFP